MELVLEFLRKMEITARIKKGIAVIPYAAPSKPLIHLKPMKNKIMDRTDPIIPRIVAADGFNTILHMGEVEVILGMDIFKTGDVELNIQETMDQIMPMMVPALLVGVIYWLLGKKYFNSTRAILSIIVLAIILKALGIM